MDQTAKAQHVKFKHNTNTIRYKLLCVKHEARNDGT